jgi:hypothetical protein
VSGAVWAGPGGEATEALPTAVDRARVGTSLVEWLMWRWGHHLPIEARMCVGRPTCRQYRIFQPMSARRLLTSSEGTDGNWVVDWGHMWV